MSGDKVSNSSAGPDFSAVDTEAKAEALLRRGELEVLLLLPHAFGGDDRRENTLYVPVGLAEVKRRVDMNIIAPLVAAGKVTQYSATPEYRGTSFIPVAVNIVAAGTTSFTTKINIWGEALTDAAT